MLQLCRKCKIEKPLQEFPKNLKCFNNVEKQCKMCKSTYRKLHYQQNKSHSIQMSRAWEKANKDKICENKKKYYLTNKEAIIKRQNIYQHGKYYSDINFRLAHNLRARLNCAIKNNQKKGSAISDLGCTIEEFKVHLENDFYPDFPNMKAMTWDNYGKWHIDHIKPLALYDLSNSAELKKACHYTNLQPLWAKDNLSKGVDYDVQVI